MKPRPTYVSILLIVLLTLSFVGTNTSIEAADSGEELFRSAGALANGNTFSTPMYSPGPANLRLKVSGGTTGNTLKMRIIKDNSDVAAWNVRSGETTWGYTNIPSGGKLTLENTSGQTLNYDIVVYARGVAPTIADNVSTWSGTSHGIGTASVIQLTVPTAGRYRFTLGATSGSFQLKVDDNYILKTVATGKTPDPADSVYYLSAGAHTFRVIQNPDESETKWSMALEEVGSTDTLPNQETTKAVLGGTTTFKEEWIPLQITEDQLVNIRVAATGTATDKLTLDLYNNGEKVYTSDAIFGGEIAWGSTQLVTGTNALRIIANDANSAPLAYSITTSVIPDAPLTWKGTSYGQPSHSTDGRSSIKLNFPTSGLYQFKLEANPGRYQLRLDNQYLQKTITDTVSADFTAYVTEGTRSLVVIQDPAETKTTWSVTITPTEQLNDKLTFSQSGGTLGGSGNTFREEWIPLQVSSGQPVNIRVVATGTYTDALQIELFNGDTRVYSATTIYGGEVFWATSKLSTGNNRLRIVTPGSNSEEMYYQVDVQAIEEIPNKWEGVTHSNGINPIVQVEAPISGIYDVILEIEEGLGQVVIDNGMPTTSNVSLASSSTTLRVPLSAGMHTFTWQQDSSQPITRWSIETNLRTATGSASTTVYLPLITR
ncbi:MAG: hypothetical protein GFH27_549303n150 [Chloroflexi bacterium AL-W]|nr:hypothetical protein [Chloroflexi bacterium AL-N1]NOK68035.1 hypothetical protein [Chloroflexi bacterium AL-N10]NOK73375.1 hypothetical protein [Chloroflexi bacterium AL-N5]NOK83289.1 hypothetical protein [Chloroflexi bacterium AL-W]NOK87706.1 hypothetical protein [Chloroflexi bacterium AL-N15]